MNAEWYALGPLRVGPAIRASVRSAVVLAGHSFGAAVGRPVRPFVRTAVGTAVSAAILLAFHPTGTAVGRAVLLFALVVRQGRAPFESIAAVFPGRAGS
jgi:hypothetical protein